MKLAPLGKVAPSAKIWIALVEWQKVILQVSQAIKIETIHEFVFGLVNYMICLLANVLGKYMTSPNDIGKWRFRFENFNKCTRAAALFVCISKSQRVMDRTVHNFDF